MEDLQDEADTANLREQVIPHDAWPTTHTRHDACLGDWKISAREVRCTLLIGMRRTVRTWLSVHEREMCEISLFGCCRMCVVHDVVAYMLQR